MAYLYSHIGTQLILHITTLFIHVKQQQLHVVNEGSIISKCLLTDCTIIFIQ